MLSDSLRRLAGIELHELQGSSVGGELPLPVTVVNRLIAERVARMQGPIAAVTLAAHDGQRLGVELSMRGQSLIPVVRIAARIVQQPEFPGRPVLVLQWTMPGFGALARLASPALSYFKALPRGVRLDGDHLFVDLDELLRMQGYGEVLAYVTRLQILTREGAFLVRFEARV